MRTPVRDLHWFCCMTDCRIWDDPFEAAGNYRVVRYDMRGHGRFGISADNFSHVEDLRDANAKSSLSLMSLGAGQGDKLIIRAEGEDEEAAAEALAELITEAEH